MKNTILTLVIVAITTISYAQVAITTDGSTPDNSAMLDIKNTEKGILIPRMTAAERDAIINPANGLLVYVTNDDSFYYNAGTTAAPNWKTIGDWSMFGPNLTYNGGNVGIGTNAANEKLTVDGNIRAFEKVISGYGSTNDAAYRFGNGMENTGFSSPVSNTLSIINNGTETVRIKSNGNVGIGTTNPSSELEVAGQIKITGGNPGNGKILTSDANGLASWENAMGASSINELSDAKTNIGSVFLGANAGINDDNINYNTGIGQNSLKTNTSGEKNSAVGYASLYLNTSGSNNAAFGYDALNHNTTGDRNTANGTYSLYSNETGSYNTSQGYGSMYKNTSGNYNVAIGLRSLYKNTDKSNLVAIGDSALFWNGTGATMPIEASQNTAIGTKTLNQNTTGYQNTAVGSDALSSNTTGRGNVAMGVSVMDSNTDGDDNTAMGNFALTSNESGEGNTALGNRALYHNIDADYNTAIGMQALLNDSTGIKNTATGFASLLLNKTGNNNVATGSKALYKNTTGSSNTAIGSQAGYETKGSNNVFIGNSAGYNETGSNKLYIDNSDTNNPLIYGDFDQNILGINGSIGVGTNTPEASAKLEVSSTTQGFLPPRVTTAQMNAISSPAEGLLVYNTEMKSIYLFDGDKWQKVFNNDGSSCGTLNYGGQSYQTVIIGDQCWMAENLNIGNMINSTGGQLNNGTIEKYCYDNNSSNCDIYGGLYQWNEMMQYSTTAGTQGICPSGWHLPTDEEYKTLEIRLGMSSSEVNNTGNRGTGIGSKLANNKPLWIDGDLEDGTNFGTSGFDVLPAGFRSMTGSTFNITYEVYLWTSSENGTSVWCRSIFYDDTRVRRYDSNKGYGHSVRCLRD